MNVQMKGVPRVLRNMGKLQRTGPDELAKAMVRVAEEIVGDAKEDCPVEFGNLKASGHVQMPEKGFLGLNVQLGFGGPAGGGGSYASAPSNRQDVGYALPVHERTDVHHEVGSAKFLEKAVQKNLPTMASKLRRDLDKAIASRFGVG